MPNLLNNAINWCFWQYLWLSSRQDHRLFECIGTEKHYISHTIKVFYSLFYFPNVIGLVQRKPHTERFNMNTCYIVTPLIYIHICIYIYIYISYCGEWSHGQQKCHKFPRGRFIEWKVQILWNGVLACSGAVDLVVQQTFRVSKVTCWSSEAWICKGTMTQR